MEKLPPGTQASIVGTIELIEPSPCFFADTTYIRRPYQIRSHTILFFSAELNTLSDPSGGTAERQTWTS
jgi:hypothetical protein